MYLACSDNNTASTVLEQFLGIVGTYGSPSRVRSDLCGENVEVWRYMMEQHGSESAVITDHPCTHNERIERLWRDVTCSVGSIHYETFQNLEGSARFEPLNEIDIF